MKEFMKTLAFVAVIASLTGVVCSILIRDWTAALWAGSSATWAFNNWRSES